MKIYCGDEFNLLYDKLGREAIDCLSGCGDCPADGDCSLQELAEVTIKEAKENQL